MIDILCLLLKPALHFLHKPEKYWYLLPVTILAWIADVFANYTTISIIASVGMPKLGEWTFSQRLERLCKDTTLEDHSFFVELAKKINRVDPAHTHIKAVL